MVAVNELAIAVQANTLTPCRVATTENIALAGLPVIDGIEVVAGDRVLVKSQTDATENGVWVASGGQWIRASDFNGVSDLVSGSVIAIVEGDASAEALYQASFSGAYNAGSSVVAFVGAFNPNVSSAWTDVTDKPTTVAGYGITDAYTSGQVDTLLQQQAPSSAWEDVTGKPTTIAGYGITDAYTSSEVDALLLLQSPSSAWADVTGKPTTVTGFGITDVYTSSEVDSLLQQQGGSSSTAWGDLTGKPTTIAGYGITDCYTKTESDGRHLANNLITRWKLRA